MFRIDDPTATQSLPAPSAPGTPGYFTDGNPTGGIPATRVTGEWLNAVQEELISVLDAAGIEPAKGSNNQLATAIASLINVAVASRTAPTGQLAFFQRSTPPPGWVKTGAQIGSVLSGAADRANDDCYDLFVNTWNEFPNSLAPVGGGRGISADADWNANKWITLPNDEGAFLRAMDKTTGRDPNSPTTLGAYREDSLKSHSHGIPNVPANSPTGGVLDGGNDWRYSYPQTTEATGGAETAPKHRVYLLCVKL